jgi:hypothetical protein
LRSVQRGRRVLRPVAFRFRTYGVDPGGDARAYLALAARASAAQEWEAAALKETAIIEADEPRLIYRDKLAAKGAASA